MRAQVVDPVAVIAALVSFQLVVGTEAVLHDEHGLFIALVQRVQRIAETNGIDRPAPVGNLDIRIGNRMRVAAYDRRTGLLYFGFYRVGHVVAETDVIRRALRQDLQIPFFHDGSGAFPLPLLVRIRAVVAAAHDIREDISLVHSLYALHDILGITGIGIEGHEAEHAADLEIGVDLMSLLHHKGCCHHLIVRGLIERLLGILKLGITDTGIGPAENIDGRVGLVVDLIEGHPVLDLILVALHDAKSIAYEEIHQFAVGPAAVLLCQIVGHLEVAECDDRLDAVL